MSEPDRPDKFAGTDDRLLPDADKPLIVSTGYQVQFKRLPAERRMGYATVAGPCCTTCCCCCCCLHSVGGVIGATLASAAVTAEGNALPAVLVYWGVLFGLVLASVPVSLFFTGGRLGFWGLWIVALFLLPVMQLLASLIAALIIHFFLPDTPPGVISRITVKAFQWAWYGLAIMVAATIMMTLIR